MPGDRFEDRLRALADQLSRSISETDLDEVANRLGVDPERVRGAAGAMEGWLTDRSSEPLFDETARPGPAEKADSPHIAGPPSPRDAPPHRSAGPDPLDLPSDEQGRALSALDSGRWTLRPGSGRLSSTDTVERGRPPEDADVTGELRARDWITAEGAVTLVGRHALRRWCRAADAVPVDDED